MDGKVAIFQKIFGDATNKMSGDLQELEFHHEKYKNWAVESGKVATKLQTMIFMAEQNSFG